MKYQEVYKNGEDNGWMHKQNYWFDPSHTNGFGIIDLDSIYPDKYFETDHVKPDTVKNYATLVMQYYEAITGTKLTDAIEFGCAGGWFTKALSDKGVFVRALEGTQAGIKKAIERGVSWEQITKHDLRLPFNDGGYSIALCTEVAEHIEPPFSATLVKSLCDASDLVWFSSEEPNTNPAHIHHPNEMPDIFWINLFDFYNYGCYKLPETVQEATEGRGKFIFFNRNTYDSSKFPQW